MKFRVTLADLDALRPCNPAESYLGPNWSGTLIDILKHPKVKVEDKIWAVTKLLNEKTARLFACYCAKESIQYVKDENLKSILNNSIEVSVRFANGNATDEERYAAESAARYAAESAAYEKFVQQLINMLESV